MKSKFLLSVFILLLFFSCKKEEACETNQTGELRLVNRTSQTIIIVIDGSNTAITLRSNEDFVRTLSVESHSIDAVSDNLIFTWNSNIDIIMCQQKEFSFQL